MRINCASLIFFLLAGAASGQDARVVNDTLDWQRYYPLEIGNTWEYGGLDSYVSTIVGDTVANDHHYFIRRDSVIAVGNVGPFIQTFYSRYDTAGTVVTLPSLQADTVEVPLPVRYSRVDFSDFLAHFDMRAAFGDTLFYAPPDSLLYVQGGYNEIQQIGNETVVTVAVKCFGAQFVFTSSWTECFAADIGFVGGGNLWGSEVTYAKVGGVEYGSRLSTPVEAAAVVPEQLIIEMIYPNPFRGRATVSYRLSEPSSMTIEVFTILGQRVWLERLSVRPAGLSRYDLGGQGWSAATYFVRLTTGRGEQSIRSVVVVK